MRKVNHRFLVNEHDDLSILSLFLSAVNDSFLCSEYKQISIVETSVSNQRKRELRRYQWRYICGLEGTVRLEKVESLSCLCPETNSKLFLEVDAVLLLINITFCVLRIFFCSLETLTERFKWHFSGSWYCKELWGRFKVLLLPNEYGDPSFLFWNLGSLKMNNQ